ncbi:MAG: GntR family transcriptional regulator [Novosphingobium sp.]
MVRVDTGISKGTSADETYEEVLRRIRDGEIGSEDRIVDKALAAELNLSRMPAREALLRLVNEGYLIGTTRGFMLPALTTEDILEIFDVRLVLEPSAAASAAVQGSGVDIAALEAALEDARAAWFAHDVSRLAAANITFRNAWLKAVPNKRHASLIERFSDQVHAVRSATLYDHDSQAQAVTLSAAVLDGFRRNDTLHVFSQMTKFVEAGKSRFIALNPEGAAMRALAARG